MPTRASIHSTLTFALLALPLGCETPDQPDIASELAPHVDEDSDGSAVIEEVEEELERDEDGWFLSAVMTRVSDFSRVGVMYDADVRAEVQVRTSIDGVEFSRWRPAEIVFDEDAAHNARYDVPEDTTFVQIRLRPSSGEIRNLTLALVEPEYEGRASFQAPPSHTAAPPFVVSRAAWGSRATYCAGSHSPNRMTVHHTVTANNDALPMDARMRQLQSFHMDVNGWCDIGYHYLVGQDGQVYEGRAESTIGAHVGGSNSNNAGISFIGTFTSVVPSAAMVSAGAKIIADIADRRGLPIDPSTVRGHRDYTSTACPGDAFYPKLGQLIVLAASGGGDGGGLYADVPESHWAYEAAVALREAGVLYGCAPSSFCPDEALTRAEIAHMLARGLELSPGPVTPLFDDVPASHPSFAEVQAIGAAGLTMGCGGGRFCPDDSLTRAQAATFFGSALDLEPAGDPGAPTFADVDADAWYFGMVEAGYEEGFIAGCATSPLQFCPDEDVTRAQAAVLHYEALGA